LLEVIGIGFHIIDYFDEQAVAHPVPPTEKIGRICRYLGEIIPHQRRVAEKAVTLDAGAALHRTAPLIQQLDMVLVVLHGEEEKGYLAVIVVVEQILDVGIGRER
jgi:hypothetical protein